MDIGRIHLPSSLFLSLAIVFASFQVITIFCSSVFRPLRQVFLGLPLLRWPCGFQSRACFVTLLSFFRNPLPFPCSDSFYWLLFGFVHSSLLLIVFGHLKKLPMMFLRHLFTKTWRDLMVEEVSLQVSEPCRRTDLTLLLKILILVDVRRVLLFQNRFEDG